MTTETPEAPPPLRLPDIEIKGALEGDAGVGERDEREPLRDGPRPDFNRGG